MKVSVLLALSSASRVSDITNLRVDYLTKHSSVYTLACQSDKNPQPNLKFYNFPQVTANSEYARKLIPILKCVMFLGEERGAGGLGKTNFLLAILININRYLHQQPLVGWDKFLQWQVSTKKSLRRTHLNQHHLQSNWGLLSKVIGHLSRSRSLVTGFNISKILQKTYLGT